MKKSLYAFAIGALFIGNLHAAEITTNKVATPVASDSLYTLAVPMVDQNGRAQTLDLYRGHPVIVTMFYGSCPNACPLLIETIRATENALPSNVRNDVRVLLISIDPQRDTPAALAAIAKTRHIDLQHWTLARVNDDDVRMLAAALGVQYRRLPDGEFNHTSVLTVLTRNGTPGANTERLMKADAAFVTAIETAAAQSSSR